MSNLPAQPQESKIFARFATKYGVDASKVSQILKATAFKQKSSGNNPPTVVTDEQMAALLIVAEQFNLNPFLKEIYAFPDKQNGIVPVIGVDGWNRIANEHPMFDGFEFKYAEKSTTVDADAKDCPEWVECIIYRKDRTRPIIIREYLEECYRPAFEGDGRNGSYKIKGPWQSHTKRFLRHKAFAQAVRMAFGFSGIYDEDEAKQIAEARIVEAYQAMPAPIEVQALPPQSPLALPISEQFNKLTLELNLNAQHCAEYVKTWAKNRNTTLDEVKKFAITQPDDFKKYFQAWKNGKTASQTTEVKAQPKPKKTNQSKTQPDPEPDPIDATPTSSDEPTEPISPTNPTEPTTPETLNQTIPSCQTPSSQIIMSCSDLGKDVPLTVCENECPKRDECVGYQDMLL